jgi:hypothetical protein
LKLVVHYGAFAPLNSRVSIFSTCLWEFLGEGFGERLMVYGLDSGFGFDFGFSFGLGLGL